LQIKDLEGFAKVKTASLTFKRFSSTSSLVEEGEGEEEGCAGEGKCRELPLQRNVITCFIFL
jgi:hypothetical protein